MSTSTKNQKSKVDIVYILGQGSAWLDNELKFSLRSVEKHITGYRDICLIGYKPAWMNDNVKFIPMRDLYTNKERNIYAKISRAAGQKDITKNFALFNDDYFFLQDTDIRYYPYYYKNTLWQARDANPNNSYRFDIQATIDVLEHKGLSLLNFDCHRPIIYSKKKWHEATEQYNWNVPKGYLTKSIYCNTNKIEGKHIPDCKINHSHITEAWHKLIQGRDMFSIGDLAINKSLIGLLNELYPYKSSFEK